MINNNINDSISGIQSLTTSGVYNGRTITGTANQISVSNGDGTAGNPTLSLTSTIQISGISFDSGTNTLSNYSTGTFTPVITGGTSNPTVSYSLQIGRYTRIGNRVVVSSTVTCSSASGGTGAIQISFPFTTVNVQTLDVYPCMIQNTTLTSTLWAMTRTGQNSSVNILRRNLNGTNAILICTSLSNTSSFTISFIIEV